MGLLTNPQTREKLVNVIKRFDIKLSVLCYFVGIGWFLALAYRPLNAGTYFSENALLPGLVTADFKHDFGAGNFYNELKDELKRIKETVEEKGKKKPRYDSPLYSLPTEWFDRKFRELGLDSYVQNYTFTYPAGILKDQKFLGQNVYGILRAPRAASTEAIVMSAPYRPPGSQYDKSGAGIGLLLALAKSFRRHTYWAKDVIFLLTDNEQIGMQAWLNAYHYQNTDHLYPGELHGRSGSIQAAINLEIGSETISKFNIKAEGLNGQLPNLDLINTVVKLCRREGIQSSLQKRNDYWHPESYEGWEHALKTMASMMWHQASNIPTGNHGLFHRYHIEAVTLQGVKLKNAKRNHSYTDMGKVIEGVFRSLNNLLERFHQSFFFYLLPATDRYVSIGVYMPPFGVMILPIIIKALALWISYTTDSPVAKEEKEGESEKSDKEKSDNKEKSETESKAEGDGLNQSDIVDESSALNMLPFLIMAVLFGLGSYRSPWFFVETAHGFKMRPQEGLALGVVAVHFAALFYPRMLSKKANEKGLVGGYDWQLQKCLGLLGLGVVLGGLGVINISLAVIIAVVWVPVVLLVRPSKNRLFNTVQYILLITISPLGFLYMSCVLQNLMLEKPADTVAALLSESWKIVENAMLSVIVDGSLFGNWMFAFITLVMFPLWLIFWSLMWAPLT